MPQDQPLKVAPPTSPPSPAVSSQLADLFDASLAPNTRRAYLRALVRLDAALDGQPLTDHALAEHLTALHTHGLAPASIALVVAAVRFRAKLAGHRSPAGPITSRALAGIRREGRGRGRGQVQGVDFSAADVAAAVASSNGLAGLRDAALIAVASDAMLRASEVVALQVADLQREDDGSGRLTIRSSKTDQEGIGATLYLGPPTMRRLRAWLEAAAMEEGPLFRRVRRGGKAGPEALAAQSVRQIIRRRCAAAGLEGRISGHSLRVGAAQSLAQGGATIVELQTAGRWASPSMPAHYARGEFAARGAVARIRYGAGAR